MKNNILIIFLLSILLTSCSSTKLVTSDDDKKFVSNVIVKENDDTTNSISESFNISENLGNPIEEEILITDKLEDNISIMDSDNWDMDLTEIQKSIIKQSDTILPKKSYYLIMEEGEVDVELIVYDDQVRVLMTIEEMNQINYTYNMVKLLENLVQKYDIENELNLSIVSSMGTEITILEEKVEILNNQLKNKDKTILSLERAIVQLKLLNKKTEEQNIALKEEVDVQKSEVKRQKRQKNGVIVGAGGIIGLLLIFLL